nr:MAG TPA: tail collar domain protein [Caudoviricetes sp.]
MQDRQGTNDLANGAVRYGVYDAAGSLLRYEWLRPEDEPLEAGTPFTAANFLTAQTAAKVWRAGDAPADPKINEALNKLADPRHRPGDILITTRYPNDTWHACDGSTFDQTVYPALYAVLGGTTLPSISYSSDTTTYIKMADD